MMLRNLLLMCTATAISQTATRPTAVPKIGSVATTTTADTSGNYPVAANIYGPFEDGFGSADDAFLTNLGCSPASAGYVPEGVDTFTAEQMIAAQCGVELPRVENGVRKGVLDACGGKDGNLYDGLSCLYDDTDANAGHSTKVGEANDAAKTPVYGKWEDRAGLAIPALDACNGHFGVTPDSNGASVYHHHVAGLPPFIIGCYGPADDPNVPQGKLVSPAACRALYPECGDGDYITVTTSTGPKVYDPYCPCFEGFSNVDPQSSPFAPPPPPSASPSTPPVASPSTPVTTGGWPGASSCDAAALTGDFDGNGRATLGDAVHIANQRMEFGSTGVNPVVCLAGDFDADGSFTLNDAAHVAEAQFNKALLPWERFQSHADFVTSVAAAGRRQLEAVKPKGVNTAMLLSMKRGATDLQVDVLLVSADQQEGAWKAISVQFSGGKIERVDMRQGSPGQIAVQHAGSFFQAADLGGSGAVFPTGLVATVSFAPGTDMKGLRIDDVSFNTYVVMQDDPKCHVATGVKCTTSMPKVKSEATPIVEQQKPPCAHTGWLKILKC